ncbi:succinate dehydrogenase, hydrophobic membrane anchor protein [Candidatus Venteria ishoeyi]|uniref:Succinate dehydrogenase hydrophobic membrane anchor subunit n=1 Tax=Candidatus Venteria ishoeyi TaxID=1899563 RepID=A0A1H6FC45_9GAMM|nr:succinate dehydrogenase, hydrophobic membrane anchor protein [Candidatus Venteria ishoeyi]SEH06614.1 Succinate dehydrogenase/Fumarate reductase transmembrane subunit [Candidatus Venteria ishoeyi]
MAAPENSAIKLNTAITRTQNLGHSGTGTDHFIYQRVSALALVPLLLWLVASLIASGGEYTALLQWLQQPWQSILLLCLIIAISWHSILGLQVIIEDYIQTEWLKLSSLLVMKFTFWFIVIAATFLVLKIAL